MTHHVERSGSRLIAGLDYSSPVDAIFINAPLPFGEGQRTEKVSLPVLGLGYVATCAALYNFNVGVLDAESDGLSPKEVIRLVNERQPRWVGLNPLAPTYVSAAEIAKGLDPAIKIMIGGHHAKAMPHETMADPDFAGVEALFLGEAEIRVANILHNLGTRAVMPGVLWRHPDTGRVIENSSRVHHSERWWLTPNITQMPFLDRNFLKGEPHFEADENGGRWKANMVGARGCPYDCSFCGAAVSANPDITIRARSPGSIIEEMDFLYMLKDVTAFRFVDDLFLGNRRYIQAMMQAFKSEHVGEQFVWEATGRINTLDKLSDEQLSSLAENGCREIALGIESGSARLLTYIDKRINPEMIKRVVDRVTQHGIKIKGYFILGFPTETREEMHETITLVHQLWDIVDKNSGDFRISVFEFRPYPGTPEWDRLIKMGKWSVKQLLNYSAVDLSNNGIDDSMRNRNEFNFSVGIQFGEATVQEVRAALAQLTREQYERKQYTQPAPEPVVNIKNRLHERWQILQNQKAIAIQSNTLTPWRVPADIRQAAYNYHASPNKLPPDIELHKKLLHNLGIGAITSVNETYHHLLDVPYHSPSLAYLPRNNEPFRGVCEYLVVEEIFQQSRGPAKSEQGIRVSEDYPYANLYIPPQHRPTFVTHFRKPRAPSEPTPPQITLPLFAKKV